MLKSELLFSSRNEIAESPLWEPRSQSLGWVDIRQKAIFRGSPSNRTFERFDSETVISAIALMRDNGFVAATAGGFAQAALADGRTELAPLALIEAERENWRLNDGACDRQGRFWAGSMFTFPNDDLRRGRLYSLSGSLELSAHQDGFLIQNGLAWSPDGMTMYVSDSHPDIRTVWTFDYDPDEGRAHGRRVFIEENQIPGRPDGAAVDVDGCYWIAASDGGRIVRLTPSGRIDAEIEVPVPNPTNLCFGGSDMKTIFITTMRKEGLGGDIYMCRSPFQGMTETAFSAGQ